MEAGAGPVVAGYVAVFALTSGMRVVSLFLLAGIEPSGLRLRHRARRVLVWTVGAVPGVPGGEIEIIGDGRDASDGRTGDGGRRR